MEEGTSLPVTALVAPLTWSSGGLGREMNLGGVADPHLPGAFYPPTPWPALPLAYIHACLFHRPEDRGALPRMWPETYHGGTGYQSLGQGPGRCHGFPPLLH